MFLFFIFLIREILCNVLNLFDTKQFHLPMCFIFWYNFFWNQFLECKFHDDNVFLLYIISINITSLINYF